MSASTELAHPDDSALADSRGRAFGAGVRATLPLLVGTSPFGMVFGAVAVQSGLSPAATQAMSALVFAGSAQFIAAGLVATGAGTALIVLTTLIVNLRHALYGLPLAPHLRHLPQRWLAPLAFWLTDETFLVVIEHYRQRQNGAHKQWYFLGSALAMYVNWQIWTYVGMRAGQAGTALGLDPRAWGLEFALPLTFIGMLVPALGNRPMVACVAAAGLTALLGAELPHQLGLMAAALVGVVVGFGAELRWPIDEGGAEPTDRQPSDSEVGHGQS
ncbi:AzlC family ABC transporter permease [Litorilinea aerophila]|uniref:AzlC family ABC transporter permease n=1 Tax=Litorilinea aerophila TaxID=1204385 RepID=A0A540VC61_9CHLR|nr:AzlC family ABC transporter permease [Litorilinea aerophila]MCC9077890.1 AzlC family ABC transporter permease [Litorilinea aerophila]GIV78243.1 MAG: branched-chain amino acid efflux pump permease component 1 AzlC family protein [Litorilinea sp.]